MDNYVLAAVAKTQKAKGLLSATINPYFKSFTKYPLALIQKEEGIQPAISKIIAYVYDYDCAIFARPCPLTPRHGFVGSRPLRGNSVEELTADALSLWGEARAVDPDAEMILSPTINAACSGVVTPTFCAVGWGNDGATAGHDSFCIPFSLACPEIPDMVGAGVTSPDVPYIETVVPGDSSLGTVKVVQYRGGPFVPAGPPDTVYSTRAVSTVLNSEHYSDLQWEKECAAYRQKYDGKAWVDGGIAAFQVGGTQGSHHAVHARLAGIAFLTTRKCTIGETLEKTALPPTYSWDAFVRGIQAGFLFSLADYASQTSALRTAIACLHQANVLTGTYAWALGASAALLTRFGLAAIAGEMRHHKGKKKKTDRNQIYDAVLSSPLAYLTYRRNLPEYHAAFKVPSNWNHSYGGIPWAGATEAVSRLDESLRQVVRVGYLTTAQHGSKTSTIAEAIAAAHVVINCAHNTGRLLNKWLNTATFDSLAQNQLKNWIVAVPFLWHLHCLKETFSEHRDKSLLCDKLARSHGVLSKLHMGGTVGIKTVKDKPAVQSWSGTASEPITNVVKPPVSLSLIVKVQAILRPDGSTHFQAGLFNNGALWKNAYAKADANLLTTDLIIGPKVTSLAGSPTEYNLVKVWRSTPYVPGSAWHQTLPIGQGPSGAQKLLCIDITDSVISLKVM